VVAKAGATPGFRLAFMGALTCWEEQHKLAAAQAQQLAADGTAASFAWARRPEEGAIVAVFDRWGPACWRLRLAPGACSYSPATAA
jgi:hypothetical protein